VEAGPLADPLPKRLRALLTVLALRLSIMMSLPWAPRLSVLAWDFLGREEALPPLYYLSAPLSVLAGILGALGDRRRGSSRIFRGALLGGLVGSVLLAALLAAPYCRLDALALFVAGLAAPVAGIVLFWRTRGRPHRPVASILAAAALGPFVGLALGLWPLVLMSGIIGLVGGTATWLCRRRMEDRSRRGVQSRP